VGQKIAIMSIIDWGNSPNTILVWRIDRFWSNKHFEEEWATVDGLASQQQKEVCVLIDIRQGLLPVTFASDLSEKIQKGISPQITCFIVIAHSLEEIFLPIFAARGLSYHCRFHLVNTVDEAYALAEHYNEYNQKYLSGGVSSPPSIEFTSFD
jgi:hypothetical protein